MATSVESAVCREAGVAKYFLKLQLLLGQSCSDVLVVVRKIEVYPPYDATQDYLSLQGSDFMTSVFCLDEADMKRRARIEIFGSQRLVECVGEGEPCVCSRLDAMYVRFVGGIVASDA